MVTIRHRGDFRKTERFFNRVKGAGYLNVLEKYGQIGVEALSSATPKDSGTTASSWTYEIVRDENRTRISWLNGHENDGVNIAIILQYGHGTGTGGFVEGIDYVNPAMRPIFNSIAEEAWKEASGK